MQISQDSEIEEDGFADIIVRVRDVLRRRWRTMAIVVGAVFVLFVVLLFLMTPKYTSVAAVRIDPSRNPLSDQTQADAQAAALTPEAIQTEISLVESDDIARAVVRRLNLGNDPEFTKGIPPTGPGGAPLTPADHETAVAINLEKHLDVERDKLSYMLAIGFTSPDRMKAALIANTFAEAYIAAKASLTSTTAGKKAAFLQGQVNALGGDISRSEAQLAAYQASAGITSATTTDGMPAGTIVDQQISPLSAELAGAKSDAATATSDLTEARAQAAQGGADTVGQVLASETIGQLRAQRAQTIQDMGQVTARYGEKHPETIRVRAQLADVDAQIKAETDRIMASLRAKAASAAARADSLQSAMNSLAQQQATNTRNAVLATSLQTELTSKRAQYDKLTQALLQANQEATNSITPSEIVDAAKPLIKPTSPNIPIMLALGFLISIAAGAGTITVQELMVAGLRTVSDIEDRLGVAMLAAIPREKSKRPADLLLERPTSLFSEAFRIARASILGVKSETPPKIIAITSALPSEGKTTTALAFARTLAINGQKTLLIDCDVRRALLREAVRDPGDRPGIVEILHDEASIADTIGAGDVENLSQLLVKAPFFSSGNLFGDGQMEQILNTLRRDYEAIVLDLPPLMGLADGRFLAVMADVVAIVVRWDATPAPAVSAAISALRSDGANIAGVLFNMVDSGADAIGGLYYSKKYAGYYQAA